MFLGILMTFVFMFVHDKNKSGIVLGLHSLSYG